MSSNTDDLLSWSDYCNIPHNVSKGTRSSSAIKDQTRVTLDPSRYPKEFHLPNETRNSLGVAIGREGRVGYVGKYSDPYPPKNLKKNQKIGIVTLLITVLILVGCILIAIPGGIEFFSREINFCLNGDKKALFSIPKILKLVTALNQFQHRLRLILVTAMNQLLTFIDAKPV